MPVQMISSYKRSQARSLKWRRFRRKLSNQRSDSAGKKLNSDFSNWSQCRTSKKPKKILRVHLWRQTKQVFCSVCKLWVRLYGDRDRRCLSHLRRSSRRAQLRNQKLSPFRSQGFKMPWIRNATSSVWVVRLTFSRQNQSPSSSPNEKN